MKRFISIMLVIVMVLSLSVAVFAEPADTALIASNPTNTTTTTGYKNYTVLGDSIPAGYGNFPGNATEGFNRVENAYPDLVANATGTQLTQLAYPATRTCELRYMIDDEYAEQGGDGTDWMFSGGGLFDHSENVRNQFKEYISDADLITLQIGANDVVVYPLNKMLDMWTTGTTSAVELNTYSSKTQNLFTQLLTYADYPRRLSQMLPVFFSNMITGYIAYMENFDEIVGKIYEMNPDADLVVVGLHNPFASIKLTDPQLIRTSIITDSVVKMINLWLTDGSKYKDKYTYVDTFDATANPIIDPIIDLDTSNNEETDGTSDFFHPNLAGHKYIAEQILSALDEDKVLYDIYDESHSTTRRIQVGEGQYNSDGGDTAGGDSSLPFTDVSTADWYYTYIKDAYEKGLMTGMTDTTFSPNGTATRAQFATIIYKMAGNPDASDLTEPFTDVDDDVWYRDQVAWSYNEGITSGLTDTTFGPNNAVTRQQLVLMLYRYAGSPRSTGDVSSFTDASSITEPFNEAIAWAVSEGIVAGYPDGSFKPDNKITRAELAVIMSNYTD